MYGRTFVLAMFKQVVGGRPLQYAPAPVTLTFDLLALKVVSESRFVPILVFLGLSVLDLGLMYATDVRQTDRQTDVKQHHRLMPRLGGIIFFFPRVYNCHCATAALQLLCSCATAV